jgi:hypothetical protein
MTDKDLLLASGLRLVFTRGVPCMWVFRSLQKQVRVPHPSRFLRRVGNKHHVPLMSLRTLLRCAPGLR